MVHANQKTTHACDRANNPLGILLQRIPARQFFNICGNLLPATQIELPHAEIRAFHARIGENGMQPLLELRANVVENL